MVDRFTLLRRKEVINICDGCRLGYVGDVEICIPEGSVKGIVVFGPCRFFGLFGRGEDYYIPWECIQRFDKRGENPDDLFQVGCIGLMKAINNFDPTKQVRFSTYGVPMIAGEVRRYLRDNSAIRVSRSIRDVSLTPSR